MSTQHKLLITGGAGFIGSNLCEYFLGQGNQVICLDNLSTGHLKNIEPFLSNKNFTFLEKDIRDYNSCEKGVEGCDFVLHQAALGSVPRSIENPMTSTDVNIGGFVNVLFAASQAKVKRFVYAASSSTYGDHPNLPKEEHVIGKALSPYAITKYVDELFAANFSEIYGMETVGLRYFNVFGRKQDPNGAYAAVIPKFVLQLMNHKSPVINGDGSYSRDFTYIDNVVHANQVACFMSTDQIKKKQIPYYSRLSIKKDEQNTLSEVFNVAYGERTSLVELVQYLKEYLGQFDSAIPKIGIEFGPNRNGDIPHSLASIEKGKQLFGYEPKFSVNQGLKLATQWYWENLMK